MTPDAPARLAAWAGSLVRTRSRGDATITSATYRWLTFGSLAIAAAVAVLWLDRGMTPFHDEWWYICGRSLTDIGSLFAPHNEHLVAVHAAAYLSLAGIFGTGSSLPFLVVLLALHAAVAAAVLRLTGSMLAAAVMLFLGAGYENLLWGFQIGMVGALAAGLWALIAFTEERPRLGTALLLIAVATQGNGLFVIPAVGAYLVASRRPRELVWLSIPAVAWAVWFLLERDAIAARGGQATLAGVLNFVADGSIATLGFGAGVGFAAAFLAAVAGGFPWRVTPVAFAGLVGLAATFVALGLVRQGFAGPESSRYLYLASPFVLLAAGELVRTARRPLPGRVGLAAAATIGGVLFVVNGLAWPGYVAEARASGADHPPGAACR